MSKLFCTFASEQEIEDVVDDILESYEITYRKIFILELDGRDDLAITYSPDFNNASFMLNNTILVHRKNMTNTLYTINALNQMIKNLNQGVLDKSFQIDWEPYQNILLLSNDETINSVPTKIFKIINL